MGALWPVRIVRVYYTNLTDDGGTRNRRGRTSVFTILLLPTPRLYHRIIIIVVIIIIVIVILHSSRGVIIIQCDPYSRVWATHARS